MRDYPETPEDKAHMVETYAPKPWMVEELRKNWQYVSWGPHEDYQWVSDFFHPNSPRTYPNWNNFCCSFQGGDHPSDESDRSGGEVVGWYFQLARNFKDCEACKRTGLNCRSREIKDTWRFSLTQDEVDVLVADGRLEEFLTVSNEAQVARLLEQGKIGQQHAQELSAKISEGTTRWREGVSAQEVNSEHVCAIDALMWICVELRAKRLGVWGLCSGCSGEGSIPVEDQGRLQLVLWVINHNTGQKLWGGNPNGGEGGPLLGVSVFMGRRAEGGEGPGSSRTKRRMDLKILKFAQRKRLEQPFGFGEVGRIWLGTR